MSYNEQVLYVRVPSPGSFYSEIVRRFTVLDLSKDYEDVRTICAIIVTNTKLFWRLPDDAQIYVSADRTMGTITVRDLKRELKEFHRKQMNK